MDAKPDKLCTCLVHSTFIHMYNAKVIPLIGIVLSCLQVTSFFLFVLLELGRTSSGLLCWIVE